MFKNVNKNKLLTAGLSVAWIGLALATDINPADAYIITSTGITVEPADVTAVTDSVLVGIQVQFESLKYLWVSILVWAATFLTNKVWSIKPGS